MEIKKSEKKQRVKPVPMPISPEEIWFYGTQLKSRHDRAFYYLLYLNGARLSEGLKVQNMQFSIESIENDQFFVGNMITLKTRNMPFRAVASPLRLDVEKDMARFIIDYMKSVKSSMPFLDETNPKSMKPSAIDNRFKRQIIVPEIVAIDFSTKSWTVIDKWGMHPHYLRHCRAAHMVTYHGYDLFQLMRFFNWTDPKMAMVYVQYDWKSLANEVRQKWQRMGNNEKTIGD